MFGIRQIPITLGSKFSGQIYCFQLNDIVFFNALNISANQQLNKFDIIAYNFPISFIDYYFHVYDYSRVILIQIKGYNLVVDLGFEYFGQGRYFSGMYIS
jgi:hypothetical protein